MNAGINFARVARTYLKEKRAVEYKLLLYPLIGLLIIVFFSLAGFFARLWLIKSLSMMKKQIAKYQQGIKNREDIEAKKYFYNLIVTTSLAVVKKRIQWQPILEKSLMLGKDNNAEFLTNISSLTLSDENKTQITYQFPDLVKILNLQNVLRKDKDIAKFTLSGVSEKSKMKDGRYLLITNIYWKNPR